MEEIVITLGKSKKMAKIKCDKDGKVIRDDKCTMESDIKIEKQIDVVGHLLSYKGNEVDVFYDDENEPWFKCLNVTKILKYTDSDQTIRRLVSNENKQSYANLIKNVPLTKIGMFDKNNLKSLYMNKSGIFELLTSSKKKEAQKFKKWVNCEVLTSIDKTGTYNMYEHNEDVIFERDDKLHVDYVVNNSALDIKNENIIYLGYIGTTKHIPNDANTSLAIGEICYKFGISTKGLERTKQHKSIIDQYLMFDCRKCIDHVSLEKDLKFELKNRSLLRNCVFGKLNYTELFTVTSTFTIDDVIQFIDDWIDKYDYKHKTDAVKLAELEIAQIIEKTKLEAEITKQKILDNEKLKLEIELLKLKNEK